MEYPTATTADEIRRNVAAIRQRIVAACARVDRDPDHVRLLPVSKTIGIDRLRLAYEAGCHELGENKVQEARRKAQAMADLPALRWSVIGHLQTNKAKYVARFASECQALDNLRVAEALERRLVMEDRTLDVLVQVNTSGEAGKYGLEPEAVPGFVQELGAFSRLRVNGLMTLARFSSDPAVVRPCFVRLRELRDRLRDEASPGVAMTTLSMGMSGDFETAVEEGATVVRVGQAIFGARDRPDSDYWPGAGRVE